MKNNVNEITLDTNCGVVKVSIDRDEKYPNVVIWVNDVPCVMLEQSDDSGTDRLYLKDYLNKYVYNATKEDFINYNKYLLDRI